MKLANLQVTVTPGLAPPAEPEPYVYKGPIVHPLDLIHPIDDEAYRAAAEKVGKGFALADRLTPPPAQPSQGRQGEDG